MDKYTKVSLLGSGTYGTVSLVKDQAGNKYAMKEISLSKDATTAGEMSQYMTREIKILNALTDKCRSSSTACPIIQYIQSFTSKEFNKTIIIMEYANGGDLNEYISDTFASQKKLQDDTILKTKVQLADDILNGLQFIHSNNIVHGDIKPENMLVHNEEIKFSDFGISCMLDTNECTYTAGTMSHLDPRILNGTLNPRQISKETDMYSLGVLLYNLFEVGIFFEGHRVAPIPEKFIDNYKNKKVILEKKGESFQSSKQTGFAFFSNSVSDYKQKTARYYELMIHLLNPYPVKRISIDKAIAFIQSGNPSALSVANALQNSIMSVPAAPLQPLTVEDVRQRVQAIVDIVFEDLKAFASSSEIITLSQMHEEMKSPINKEPLEKLKPWNDISKIVSEIIEAKINQESNTGSSSTNTQADGGGRLFIKKTDKKVYIAGKHRCVYLDANRKQYIKKNGTMVSLAGLREDARARVRKTKN